MKKAPQPNNQRLSAQSTTAPSTASKANAPIYPWESLLSLPRTKKDDHQLKQSWDAQFFGTDKFEPIKAQLSSNADGGGGACGRQFKPGEAAYQCSKCGVDPTCIQCVTCYRAADHRDHEQHVRMVTAGGGGCCDCGDLDSWRLGGTCTKHKPKTESEMEADASSNAATELIQQLFSEDQRQRMSQMLQEMIELVSYAVDVKRDGAMHTWPVITAHDKCFLSTKPPDLTHFVYLLNDDTHSFNEVIGQLNRAIGLVPEEGTRIANMVHGTGQAIMCIGTLAQCTNAANVMHEIGLGATVHPINHETTTIVRESRLLTLIEWLSSIAQLSHVFRDQQSTYTLAELKLKRTESAIEKSSIESTQLGSEESKSSVEFSTSAATPTPSTSGPTQPSRPSVTGSGMKDDEEEAEEAAVAADAEDENDEDHEHDDSNDENEDEEEEDDEEYNEDDDEGEGDEGDEAAENENISLENLLAEMMAEYADSGEAQPPPNVIFERLITRQRELQAARLAGEQKEGEKDKKKLTVDPKTLAQLEDKIELSGPAKKLSSRLDSTIFLDSLLLYSTYLHADVFRQLTGLVFSWFGNIQYKTTYAIRFMRHYSTLIEQWRAFSGRLDHSTMDYTVQLLTIPTIAFQLTQQHGVYEVLMQQLYHHLARHRPTNQPTHSYIDCAALARDTNPFMLILSHIEYILRCPAVPKYLLQENTQLTLRSWFRILQLQESMDAAKRKEKTHVQYESSAWKHAFTLAIRCNNVTQLLLNSYAESLVSPTLRTPDRNRLISDTLDICQQAIRRLIKYEEFEVLEAGKTESNLVTSIRGVPLLNYNPDWFSVHHPLHHFISELIFGLQSKSNLHMEERSIPNLPISSSPPSTSTAATPAASNELASSSSTDMTLPIYHELLDCSSRQLAFLSHVRSGLWIFNGQSVLNQCYNYTRSDVANLFIRSDFTAIQQSVLWNIQPTLQSTSASSTTSLSSMSETSQVSPYFIWVNVLLRRFLLAPFFHLSTDVDEIQRLTVLSESSKWYGVLESFLETTLIILTDRQRIGRLTRTDRVRDELIHRLMVQSCTYSQLVKGLDKSITDEEDEENVADTTDEVMDQIEMKTSSTASSSTDPTAFDLKALVQTVATYQKSRSGGSVAASSGVWELKSEYLSHFNPYYMNYTDDERHAAASNYMERVRSEQEKLRKKTKQSANEENSIGLYPPKSVFAPFLHPGFEALSQTLIQPEMMELVHHVLKRYVWSAQTIADPQIAASTPFMLDSYIAPPKAGNARGTHERILTHTIYTIALATQECQKQLQSYVQTAVAPASASVVKASSPSSASSLESIRRFLRAFQLVNASTQVNTSVFHLLCQLQATARLKRQGVKTTKEESVSTPTATPTKQLNQSSASPSPMDVSTDSPAPEGGSHQTGYSDWDLSLQAPWMTQILTTLLQLEQQVQTLDSNSDLPLYAVFQSYQPATVTDINLSSDSISTEAASSSSGDARAIRLKRGLRIRRRLVKQMQQRQIEFSTQNQLPLPKLIHFTGMKKKKTPKVTESSSSPMITDEEGVTPTPSKFQDLECIICRSSAQSSPAGYITFNQPSTIHHRPIQTPPSLPFQPRIRTIGMSKEEESKKNDSSIQIDGGKVRLIECSHRSLPLAIDAAEYVLDVRDTSVPVVFKSCMHVLHYSCLDSYVAGLYQRRNDGQLFEGIQSANLDENEFICPLCRQLANCLVPITQLETQVEGKSQSTSSIFHLTQALQPISTVIKTNQSAPIQEWLQQLPTPSVPPFPPANLFSSAQYQYGLISSLGTTVANRSGRRDTTIDNFSRMRYLFESMHATIRAMEIGYRFSAYAYEEWCTKQLTRNDRASIAPLSIETQLTNFDVEFLSTLMENIALYVYMPTNQNLLPQLRSSWFALLQMVGLISPLMKQEATNASTVGSSASTTSIQGGSPAASKDQTVQSPVATSEPAKKKSLFGGLFSSAPKQQASKWEDDDTCLPNLSSRQLLLEDPFELLLRCVISYGYDTTTTKASQDLYSVLYLIWHLHIIQIATHFAFANGRDNQHQYGREHLAALETIYSKHHPAKGSTTGCQTPGSSCELLQTLVEQLRVTHPRSPPTTSTTSNSYGCCSPSNLSDFISLALPFLRRATILFRSINLIAPLSSGTISTTSSFGPFVDEYHYLLQRLNLPDLDVINQSSSTSAAMEDVTSSTTSAPSTPSLSTIFQLMIATFRQTYPIGVPPIQPLFTTFVPPSFIQLPPRYDELFQALTDENVNRCTTCGSLPKDPALCLCCGRMLCPQGSCCKTDGKGELTKHTERCSPCNGYYLLLKECGVMMITHGLSLSSGSCYADAENELDLLLRRGRPLYLNQERLEFIRKRFALIGETTSTTSRARNARYLQELPNRNLF